MKNRPDKTVERAFGELVYEYRKKANYSQTKLATLTHMDSTNIGRIERGDTAPTFHSLIKISAALNIDLNANFETLAQLIYAEESGKNND